MIRHVVKEQKKFVNIRNVLHFMKVRTIQHFLLLYLHHNQVIIRYPGMPTACMFRSSILSFYIINKLIHACS